MVGKPHTLLGLRETGGLGVCCGFAAGARFDWELLEEEELEAIPVKLDGEVEVLRRLVRVRRCSAGDNIEAEGWRCPADFWRSDLHPGLVWKALEGCSYKLSNQFLPLPLLHRHSTAAAAVFARTAATPPLPSTSNSSSQPR